MGKMQGIDVFDMKPLDASRTGEFDISLPAPRFDQRIEEIAAAMPLGENLYQKRWMEKYLPIY